MVNVKPAALVLLHNRPAGGVELIYGAVILTQGFVGPSQVLVAGVALRQLQPLLLEAAPQVHGVQTALQLGLLGGTVGGQEAALHPGGQL